MAETKPDPFIVFGTFIGTDDHNIIIDEPRGKTYIPKGCIRKPGWIRVLNV